MNATWDDQVAVYDMMKVGVAGSCYYTCESESETSAFKRAKSSLQTGTWFVK